MDDDDVDDDDECIIDYILSSKDKYDLYLYQ